MAEELGQAVQAAQEPQAQAARQQEPTDWKAEARKHEERAKQYKAEAAANKAAAAELEALKAQQMTDQQKAEARAVKAEAEVARLTAEAERRAAVDEVAASTGVPAALLAYCADRESMEAFARDYAASAAQRPATYPEVRDGGLQAVAPAVTAADRFSAAVNNALSR